MRTKIAINFQIYYACIVNFITFFDSYALHFDILFAIFASFQAKPLEIKI